MEARRLPPRWCLVCNKELVTCKKYFSIKDTSVKVTRDPSFLPLLYSILGEIPTKGSEYICEQCDTKINKVRASHTIQAHVREQFFTTKVLHHARHHQSPVKEASTPKLGQCMTKIKRKAVHSPGTPSTRKVSDF